MIKNRDSYLVRGQDYLLPCIYIFIYRIEFKQIFGNLKTLINIRTGAAFIHIHTNEIKCPNIFLLIHIIIVRL